MCDQERSSALHTLKSAESHTVGTCLCVEPENVISPSDAPLFQIAVDATV